MSDSKYKVEFTLKQHTPIIHFQSGQPGATLRATELKPKLDRFLLERVDGLPFVKNPNGHRSLNYKVTIEPNISQREKISGKNPLFFGNMGVDKLPDAERQKQEKFFKFSGKVFKVTFFSFQQEVREAISRYFETFLAQTNFGTRQSKGFGSFSLDHPLRSELLEKSHYSFFSSVNMYQEDIKLLYAFLRQGINYPKSQENCPETRFYAKPAIFAYAKKQGWTWDKKAIKQYYFSETLTEQQNCRGDVDVLSYDGKEEYLLRDLFGLSSEQSWKSFQSTITKENNEIARFKSPVTFKPVMENDKRMRVYFWADESVSKILDKEFSIKAGREKGLKLKTPENFDFDDFFEFAFSIDLSKHIDSQFHDTEEYRRLTRIYNDIKGAK